MCGWRHEIQTTDEGHFDGTKYQFTLIDCKSYKEFIFIQGKWGHTQQIIFIVNVYDLSDYREKRDLWENIIRCKSVDDNKVWCMISDFNVVRKLEERRGMSQASRGQREILAFNQFLESINMVDLPMIGRRFTCYIVQERLKSRLDRMLISLDWMRWGQIVDNLF